MNNIQRLQYQTSLLIKRINSIYNQLNKHVCNSTKILLHTELNTLMVKLNKNVILMKEMNNQYEGDVTMNNQKLINKVYELWNRQTLSREEAKKVSTQCYVIRRAFDVREWEIIKKPKSYERNQVMTDKEIKNKFIESKELAEYYNDQNNITYFIEAVSFFNEKLSNELKTI